MSGDSSSHWALGQMKLLEKVLQSLFFLHGFFTNNVVSPSRPQSFNLFQTKTLPQVFQLAQMIWKRQKPVGVAVLKPSMVLMLHCWVQMGCFWDKRSKMSTQYAYIIGLCQRKCVTPAQIHILWTDSFPAPVVSKVQFNQRLQFHQLFREAFQVIFLTRSVHSSRDGWGRIPSGSPVEQTQVSGRVG